MFFTTTAVLAVTSTRTTVLETKTLSTIFLLGKKSKSTLFL